MVGRMPDDYLRLPQRRPSLRSVPATERYVAPVPAAAIRVPQPSDEGLLETLRKLWRHRRLIGPRYGIPSRQRHERRRCQSNTPHFPSLPGEL